MRRFFPAASEGPHGLGAAASCRPNASTYTNGALNHRDSWTIYLYREHWDYIMKVTSTFGMPKALIARER